MEVIDRTRSVGHAILEAPRSAIARGRSNPRLAVAAIVGALLLIAWIAWAIYVTSDKGANAGLGVVLSWPVLLAALALIAAPFVGLYFLLRSLSSSDEADAEPSISGGSADAEADTDDEPAAESEEDEDEDEDEDVEDEDSDEDEDEDEDADEEEDEEDEEEREETDPDEEPPSGEEAKASGQR